MPNCLINYGRFSMPALLLAACTPAPGDTAPPAERQIAQAPNTQPPTAQPNAPYPDDLARMPVLAEPWQAPGQPCLFRERPKPAGADAIPKSRWREIQSDSYWLGRWAKDNLGQRLAYAVVTGAEENGAVTPIYEIAVTGNAPIHPPALGDRAKDVPVRVVYDYPVSFDEFMARRERSNEEVAKLVPNWNGEGGSPGPHGSGFVRLDVYSPGGQPDAAALAQCDALRRAYRLPVLMEFSSARITLD